MVRMAAVRRKDDGSALPISGAGITPDRLQALHKSLISRDGMP